VRQKGSGGARHGSKRVNVFRGGGVVHGPTPRDHSFDLPKKVRALALKTAFSAKKASGELTVIDSAKMDAPKTKALKDALAKYAGSTVLLMDVTIDGNLQMAANNIVGVNCLPTAGANVYDLLAHEQVLITKDAAEALEVRFGLREASGE
jgi:large subunit ribosomal protein L4